MFALFSTLTLLLLVSFNFQEVKSVTCTYEFDANNEYMCNLINQTIQSEGDLIEENGTHEEGFAEDNVITLIATQSTVQIFPSLLIDKFKNLRNVILNDVGMKRFTTPIYISLSISFVVLTSNEISSVPESIFTHCDKLTELHLSYNRINSINDLAFWGLSGLTNLSLANNQIVELKPEIFEKTPSLQSLYLNGNSIGEVSPQTFEQLPSLQKLWLNDNKISTWNSTLHQSNQQLEELLLDQNEISTLSGNTFSNLPQLKVLRVGSLMENVPILTGASSLEELGLNNNRFKQVSADSFSDLVNLTKLDLSFNNIETVNFTVSSTILLPNLDTLNLASNNISEIDRGTFTMLSNLTNLDLSKNEIAVLEAESIRPITQMKRLDVSYNQIKRIERDFFTGVTNLSFVSLGNSCFNDEVDILNSKDFEDRVAALLAPCFDVDLPNLATLPKVNIFVTAGMFLFIFVWKM